MLQTQSSPSWKQLNELVCHRSQWVENTPLCGFQLPTVSEGEVVQRNAHHCTFAARIIQLLQHGWFKMEFNGHVIIQQQDSTQVGEWESERVDYFVKKTMPLVWGSFLRTSHDCFTSRSLSLEYTGGVWSATSGTATSTTEESAIGTDTIHVHHLKLRPLAMSPKFLRCRDTRRRRSIGRNATSGSLGCNVSYFASKCITGWSALYAQIETSNL